jgi:hypothetical protein
MNRYKVKFVFDYTTISTNVISPDEDSCSDIAADLIHEDLGYSNLSSMLYNAQDIVVELVEENVL